MQKFEIPLEAIVKSWIWLCGLIQYLYLSANLFEEDEVFKYKLLQDWFYLDFMPVSSLTFILLK